MLHSQPRFLLDESLSRVVADALEMVGYAITSCQKEGLAGCPDEELIAWMGERGYVWITKDGAARNEHRAAILRARISVVWLRGVELRNRTTARNDISPKQQHRILTDKLDDIGEAVSRANGPRYFVAYMRNNGPAMQRYTTLEQLGR